MNLNLSDAQRRILFELVIVGEKPLMSTIPKAQRTALMQAGLIELQPRAEKLRGKVIVPTETGWAWVVDNLDAPFSGRVQLHRVWNQLAKKLQVYLQINEDNLVSVLNAEVEEPTVQQSTAQIDAEVERAYLSLTDQHKKQRIRITDLRGATKLDSSAVDASLLRLFESETIVLYPEDDHSRLGPQARTDAMNLSGVPQHIIYWER